MRSASSGGFRRPVRSWFRLTEGVTAGSTVGNGATLARPRGKAT